MLTIRCLIAFCITILGSNCTLGTASEFASGFDQLAIVTAVAKENETLQQRPELLIHFHGAPAVTERNYHRSRRSGVLVTVNCQGLSSAYRKPFENPKLFTEVIRHVRRTLVLQQTLKPDAEWGKIHVSCFSAGYGAVRELLKQPKSVERISSVVAADSIYASIKVSHGRRSVDAAQMEPFVAFARQAIRRDKFFLLSHSQLPVEPYASTVETSDFLLSAVNIERKPVADARDGFQPISRASHGQFTVLGYAGRTGEDHLQHLRRISDLWRQLPREDAKQEEP